MHTNARYYDWRAVNAERASLITTYRSHRSEQKISTYLLLSSVNTFFSVAILWWLYCTKCFRNVRMTRKAQMTTDAGARSILTCVCGCEMYYHECSSEHALWYSDGLQISIDLPVLEFDFGFSEWLQSNEICMQHSIFTTLNWHNSIANGSARTWIAQTSPIHSFPVAKCSNSIRIH